jgi:hypothetical protein
MEQLAAGFDHVTGEFVAEAARQLELARAMQDQEAIVREQIKLGVMDTARRIFQSQYQRITGERAWNGSEVNV